MFELINSSSPRITKFEL